MTRRPRYKHYVRIGQIGTSWKACVGWTCDQSLSSRHHDDLDKLIAECRQSFPDAEILLPPQEVIDAGLPPWPIDVVDAVIDWLAANPSLNPTLLAMARRAEAAEREPYGYLPWSVEAENRASAMLMAAE